MTTFTLRGASADATPSPQGVPASDQYQGLHGPAFVAYTHDQRATHAWGPHLPDTRLDLGPWGRLDGKQIGAYLEPAPLQVGAFHGEVVRCDWALFNRRRRGITIRLGPRSYLYRVTGGLARQLLEREDGTAVAMLRGLRGDDKFAESADAVDLALALVMFFGVPISAIKAQA